MVGSPITLSINAALMVASLLGAFDRFDKPAVAHSVSVASPRLFITGDVCLACHNTLVTPRGGDMSIGADWRSSMMANSARDPYWQASVRRELLDHPAARAAIEDECSKCHMPMARFQANADGGKGVVFDHLADASSDMAQLALDGVSCTTCHQIEPTNLGKRESFTGNFAIDTRLLLGQRKVYGPFAVDSGHNTIMRSASQYRPTQGLHMRASEMCATCHTLYTDALNDRGEKIGELPEQMPFQEWQHSSYAGERSCQSCHMPVVTDSVPITGVLGVPRYGVSRHTFRGGNFFMQRMLNRFRSALGVRAPSSELSAAADRTVEQLEKETAEIAIGSANVVNGTLIVDVALNNLTGHKLPTGYPSRRVWIHFSVVDATGAIVFESGKLNADGSIAGNDNDENALSFEPHHEVIEQAQQVQIFESVMVSPQGVVTTGLLTATGYAKDNRLLPRGFDKTSAHPDIAVHGGAMKDADFIGGSDRVQYRAPLRAGSGPYRVRVELLYQPIGFRWADNLRGRRTMETDRFVEYYGQMAGGSAARLAAAERIVQ